MVFSLVLALIVGVIAGFFALQNQIPVTVTFFRWHYEGSLGLILVTTLACGALTATLMLTPPLARRYWTILLQRRKIKKLEKQIEIMESELPPPPPPPPARTARF